MSSVIPFTFNAVGLCVVTINEKPWTPAQKVCRVLEYNKKTAVTAAGKLKDWPKDSQKYGIYTNEERMYELLFSSQQPKAKDFRRHCCNVLFPHVRQQLSNKLYAMEIENLTGRVQALEFMNEAYQQEILRLNEEHQQIIEEKDASFALLNDDLQNREYENVALQAQRDVYQAELQKCQDIITHLKTCYVTQAKNLGKDNTIIIVWKHLPMINIMTCHIMLRGYSNVKGMLN